MEDLFVIEAPGKAQKLEAVLAGIGRPGRVVATRGHLLEMPSSLYPVGVDCRFHEYERKPRDPAIVERIREFAGGAGRLMIATDADQEGDVIAWDVAEICRDLHPEPLRIRLRGMDPESVAAAIAQPEPVRLEDAIPGRTRAIVDRMIGAAFSRDGIAVGRVSTAMLGHVAKSPPARRRLRLVAPAKDGGRPWRAEADVAPPLDDASARRLAALALPALEPGEVGEPSSPAPGNMGDVMVRAGDVLGMGPSDAAAVMQNLYEAGEMSYPRAISKGLSPAAAKLLEKSLKGAGFPFDSSKIAHKPADDAHDAPHPIGRVNITLDPEKLGRTGLRNLVARDLVQCGQTRARQRAVVEPLAEALRSQGFPEEVVAFVRALDWHREVGPAYPGQEAWPQSEVIERRQDTVLLQSMTELGLGRPSTWARHVDLFLSRGLVDEDFALTRRGYEWMEASPRALLDPQLSIAVEKACEATHPSLFADPDREPWEVLAEFIVRRLPESIRKPVSALNENEPARPRVDPVGRPGMAAEILASAEPRPQPAYVPEEG